MHTFMLSFTDSLLSDAVTTFSMWIGLLFLKWLLLLANFFSLILEYKKLLSVFLGRRTAWIAIYMKVLGKGNNIVSFRCGSLLGQKNSLDCYIYEGIRKGQ